MEKNIRKNERKNHTEESNVNSESFLHFIYDSVVSWTSSLQRKISSSDLPRQETKLFYLTIHLNEER